MFLNRIKTGLYFIKRKISKYIYEFKLFSEIRIYSVISIIYLKTAVDNFYKK